MIRKESLDLPIVNSQRGIVWTSKEADEKAREDINQMLEGLNLNHRNGSTVDVPIMAFRRSGLLGLLNTKFEGDISRALRFARPDIFSRPPLDLETYRLGDQVQAEWQQREEKIRYQIDSRTHRQEKELLLGRGGEPITLVTRRRRKKPRVYQTATTYSVLQPLDKVLSQEVDDERKILDTFIRPGQQVLKLLGSYEISALSQILGKVGTEGRVYYITPATHLKEQLFDNFMNLFANLRGIKGEEVNHKALSGEGFLASELLPKSLARQLKEFLATPFTNELDLYQNGYQDLSKLSDAFYETYPITPLAHSIPPFPSEIKSRSIDVVLELDRFSRINEDQKEEFLWEIDRVLKPDGLILIREGSQQQTEIEYYGQELFDGKYKRWRTPKGVRHWPRWIIFSKSTVSSFPVPAKAIEVNGYENHGDEALGKKDLIREILLAKSELDQMRTEHATIPLTWFRERGLLQVLMLEFGGNIDEAIASTTVDNNTKGSESIIAVTTLPPTPKDAKTTYGVEDLAEELKLPRNKIQKAIRNLGIKALGASTGKAGRSGFTKRAVESRKIHLSYQEYIVVRDALKSQGLQPKKTSEKKGEVTNRE